MKSVQLITAAVDLVFGDRLSFSASLFKRDTVDVPASGIDAG